MKSMSSDLAQERLARAHVVLVGAGGLGCPAAWALTEAGVGRLTVLDADAIEPSNLPRQILYREEDVGRPKVEVLAERLTASGSVEPRAERLDETNEETVLQGVDLVLDATDGALTKDWLNALAVRRRIPLVHAAALRSEGRLLMVPAGGRPCLACLFGRLEEESGTCADLGVWNGVVGATGFLAAAAALRRLTDPHVEPDGYVVLDFEGGRAVSLEAAADPSCPVCARAARLEPEGLPGLRCAAEAALDTSSADVLDLREEQCPMNLLRARRALEDLVPRAELLIRLGAEGRDSVPDGLRALGHRVLEERDTASELVVLVERGEHATPRVNRLDRDQLLRYARQVVLPEVGETGQRKLLDAVVVLGGEGPMADTARLYLRAAGIGHLEEGPAGREPVRVDVESPEGATSPRAERATLRAGGCVIADRVSRRVVLGGAPASGLSFAADGRIRT